MPSQSKTTRSLILFFEREEISEMLKKVALMSYLKPPCVNPGSTHNNGKAMFRAIMETMNTNCAPQLS